MSGHLRLNKLHTFARQVSSGIQRLAPGQVLHRPQIRISFDVDDTLACQPHHSAAEHSRLPAVIHRWLGEPLRTGTRTLTKELRRQGCSIWVYTSSGRTPSYIRRWLLLYGVHVDGIVNSVRHSHALNVHGFSNAPSKFPPAFGIDLHVDDSEGVQIEGYDYGFRVVVVRPDDENWVQRVIDAVAEVQAAVRLRATSAHLAKSA